MTLIKYWLQYDTELCIHFTKIITLKLCNILKYVINLLLQKQLSVLLTVIVTNKLKKTLTFLWYVYFTIEQLSKINAVQTTAKK